MKKISVRTSPPSSEANNQDVFIWALYLLGGGDSDVDVEDVYLKSFELAPARLGWRTHPEIPDYKKTSKALQSVEAKTHVGLVHKVGPYNRRLTSEGAAWVERYRVILEQTYSSGQPVSAAKQSNVEYLRRSVRNSSVYENWINQAPMDLSDLADALECSPTSSKKVWKDRLEDLKRTAHVAQDDELAAFAGDVAKFLEMKIGEI